MITTRNRGKALLVALAIGVALSACSPLSGPADEPIAVPTIIPFGDGSAEITSGIPEGFPSDVPLIEGEIVRGLIARDDSGTAYMVSIESEETDPASIIEAQMDVAGFAVSAETPAPGSVLFESGEWQVAVVVGAEGTPEGTVVYLATQLD